MKTGKRALRRMALCVLLALGLLLAGAGWYAQGAPTQQPPVVLQLQGGGSVTLSPTHTGYRLCAADAEGRTLYSQNTPPGKTEWQAEIPGVGPVAVRAMPGACTLQLLV